ncbi:MAG: hypothetical protein ACXVSL_17005, partial [Solirubrobacteraceae bacterium]
MPAITSGRRAIPNAATTAIGTSATGTANTKGTNASWVGTVKPKGVSKCTRVASTRPRKHNAA